MRPKFKRVGNAREASLTIAPYFPSLIFVTIDQADFATLHSIRHLGRKWLAIAGQRDGRRIGDAASVDRFFAEAEAELQEAIKIDQQAKDRRALMAEFKAGQAVQALDGPFKEKVAHFVKLTHAPHDPHPVAVVEVEVMGRTVLTKIDPIALRAASQC